MINNSFSSWIRLSIGDNSNIASLANSLMDLLLEILIMTVK